MENFEQASFKSWQDVIEILYNRAMQELAESGIDKKEVKVNTIDFDCVHDWFECVSEFIEDVYGLKDAPIEMIFNGNMPYEAWHTDSYESLKKEFDL